MSEPRLPRVLSNAQADRRRPGPSKMLAPPERPRGPLFCSSTGRTELDGSRMSRRAVQSAVWPRFLRSISASYWGLREGSTIYAGRAGLPAIVGERLVGVGHLVGVFTLLDGVALVRGGIQQLAGQLLLHGPAVGTIPGGADQPAHAERDGPIWTNVHRHLIGATADPPGLDLHLGLDVVEGAVPDLYRIILGLLRHDIERTVDDALGDGLLTVPHDRVHELGDSPSHVDLLIRELGIRKRFSFRYFAFTWHRASILSSLNQKTD